MRHVKSLNEYIQMAAKDGTTRSGIILGIRLAMLGLMELGTEEPDRVDRSAVVVFVETDRCLPDAIELVTGCRLGNRKLKLRDMGKMAATFLDLSSGRAVRVASREGFAEHGEKLFPELDREAALARSYKDASDEELFSRAKVSVQLRSEDIPGYHAARTTCTDCGEGISFGREVRQGSRTLCLACAGHSYYILA
jgi:formylmethanofuran dehydrogenase subunit E